MWHWLHVAVYSGHPFLGLCHGMVEDGYLPRALLRWWPALDAITRRKNELFYEYIERVRLDPKASRVVAKLIIYNLRYNYRIGFAKKNQYRLALARLAI